MVQTNADEQLLSANEVASLLRCSKSQVYELIKKDESFPSSILISARMRRWRRGDINVWIDGKRH